MPGAEKEKKVTITSVIKSLYNRVRGKRGSESVAKPAGPNVVQPTVPTPTTPTAASNPSVGVSASIQPFMEMLEETADARPDFLQKFMVDFSGPATSTGTDKSDDYVLTYKKPTSVGSVSSTRTALEEELKLQVKVNKQTKQSEFSLKDPTNATAEDFKILALTAIHAAVVAAAKATPAKNEAEPLHLAGIPDDANKRKVFLEGVQAAVTEYYTTCLQQTPRVKPTLAITSKTHNEELQKCIEAGKTAALGAINTPATAAAAPNPQLTLADVEKLQDTDVSKCTKPDPALAATVLPVAPQQAAAAAAAQQHNSTTAQQHNSSTAAAPLDVTRSRSKSM